MPVDICAVAFAMFVLTAFLALFKIKHFDFSSESRELSTVPQAGLEDMLEAAV